MGRARQKRAKKPSDFLSTLFEGIFCGLYMTSTKIEAICPQTGVPCPEVAVVVNKKGGATRIYCADYPSCQRGLPPLHEISVPVAELVIRPGLLNQYKGR